MEQDSNSDHPIRRSQNGQANNSVGVGIPIGEKLHKSHCPCSSPTMSITDTYMAYSRSSTFIAYSRTSAMPSCPISSTQASNNRFTTPPSGLTPLAATLPVSGTAHFPVTQPATQPASTTVVSANGLSQHVMVSDETRNVHVSPFRPSLEHSK